jgi:UDP-N-acetylglucosamine--N-acetylmuramyl-(pentapeptide) pyrophosphoryl-undecaprenol N-acetylglucosamine transferase
VYPAIAVADALVDAGVAKGDIVFFGGSRMEVDAVPAAGYEFVGVEIRGLRRSASLENLKLPGIVRRATRRIAAELDRRAVSAVGVFGGYISLPAALAARRLHVPVIVHEQNAHPGLANRLISPRATTTLVAFPSAKRRLKRARVVGNPLRPELAKFVRADLRDKARERYDLPAEMPVLGVLGGSLGALVLNEVTVRIAADADPGQFAIVHLTGHAHSDSFAPVAARSPLSWTTRPYEPDMEYFYAAADVVLARAGALTVSELAATATPAVLVPLEATHQAANTAHLEEAGGVVVISQQEIERVPVELQQLLHDVSRRDQMARAAGGFATPDAAAQVAAELIGAAGG